MILKKFLLVLLPLIVFSLHAQKKKEVLFTVDKQPVYTDEFLRVFNKNRDIVEEENRKTIDEYLELYINYKLKLKQAYFLGLDTIASYKNELKKYREQLIQPYLKDSKVTNALVKEVHSRMLEEVNASHILVRLNPKASPADTLKAYNKILEARNKVLAGASFNEVAKQYSEDPSAKKNGGDLGYFTAFGMVYPFENAAYTNKIGEVSMPFKTNFGYHIIKVNDRRPARGEVEVAHIMVKNNPKDTAYAKKQINDIYAKLLQGDKFDFLAQQYSDDKASAPKGGRLPKFSANKMIPSFSDVAFSLKKKNDISKPFKTPYGWHIARLLKKYPVKSYEELKNGLIKKIENSPRAGAAGKSVADRLKKEYKIEYNKDLKQLFLNNDTEKLADQKEKMLFSINGKEIPVKELITYSNKQRNKSLLTTYNDFLNLQIIDHYKENLENTNKDFAVTMQEYKDGLLLFDLLQQKVWKRAENDTIALRQFFNEHRQNYMYKKRGDVIIATCTKLEKAEIVKKHLKENKIVDEIKNLVNEGATIHVLFSSGMVEVGNRKLPKGFELKEGVSKVYKEGDKQFIIVKVNKVLEPSQKELREAKGLVINDFQEHIEEEWVKGLRSKHTVKVNKRTLKKLVKKYPN